MINILTKLGALSLVGSLILWVVQDLNPDLPLSTPGTIMAYVGAGCLALGLCIGLYSILVAEARRASGSRCVRCGKPVARGLSYCEKHLRDVASEITHSKGISTGV